MKKTRPMRWRRAPIIHYFQVILIKEIRFSISSRKKDLIPSTQKINLNFSMELFFKRREILSHEKSVLRNFLLFCFLLLLAPCSVHDIFKNLQYFLQNFKHQTSLRILVSFEFRTAALKNSTGLIFSLFFHCEIIFSLKFFLLSLWES